MDRRPILPALLLCALAVAHAANGAEPPPGSPATAPLAFADESISTTCERLARGHPIVVVNRTIEPLRVFARWGHFREQQTKALATPRSICGGLADFPRTPKARVEPGATYELTLRLTQEAEVATAGKKAFTGTLALYTTAGVASSVPVTIAAREPTTTVAKPLQASVTNTADTKLEWRGPSTGCDFGRWPPVARVPDTGDSVSLWIAVEKPPASKSIEPPPAGVLGTLAGDGNEFAPLTFVRTEHDGPVARIGLHTGRLPPGEYEGKVDLNGDAQGGEVSLSLTVKDPWYAAALAILVSLLVAGLLQRLYGVVLPKRQLRHEIETLSGELSRARQTFRGGAPEPWHEVQFIADDEQMRLSKKLQKKTHGAVLQIDQKVIDSVRSDIEAASATIDGLGALARRLRDVPELLDTQPTTEMPDRFQQDPEQDPLIARNAEEATKPPDAPMQLADVEARKAALDAALKDVKALIDVELQIASLVDDWKTLNDDLHPDEPRRSELPGIWDALVGVWHQIWNAGTTAQLAGYADEIGAIDNRTAALWPLLDDARERAVYLDALVLRHLRAKAVFARSDLEEDYRPAPYVLEQPGVPRRQLVREAPSRPRYGLTLALLVVAVAVGVVLAVLAGMTALYKDKPFGSGWDYIAAITYGLVVPPAIAGLIGLTNRLGETAALRRLLPR